MEVGKFAQMALTVHDKTHSSTYQWYTPNLKLYRWLDSARHVMKYNTHDLITSHCFCKPRTSLREACGVSWLGLTPLSTRRSGAVLPGSEEAKGSTPQEPGRWLGLAAPGWPWAGRGLAAGWPRAGLELALGWPRASLGLAPGRPWLAAGPGWRLLAPAGPCGPLLAPACSDRLWLVWPGGALRSAPGRQFGCAQMLSNIQDTGWVGHRRPKPRHRSGKSCGSGAGESLRPAQSYVRDTLLSGKVVHRGQSWGLGQLLVLLLLLLLLLLLIPCSLPLCRFNCCRPSCRRCFS